MQCPNCVTQTLVTTQRRDIDIDHCPNCGGVWLDKGEMEKIMSLADEEHSLRDWRGRDEGREETYGRSRRRSSDYDDEQDDDRGYEREERYEEEDEGGSRERGRYGSDRGEGEDDRERDSYGRDNTRDERPSIWREIFENLEKLPLPRV